MLLCSLIPPDRRVKGKGRLKAPAQPALVNKSLLSVHRYLKRLIQQDEVQKKTSISLNTSKSSRMNAHRCFAELR